MEPIFNTEAVVLGNLPRMEVPEALFVFVNDRIPAVAHNMRFAKRLVSGAAGGWSDPGFLERYLRNEIDWLPFTPNASATPWLSFYSASLLAGYSIEFGAELCRRSQFPNAPSRLSAIYAFGDEASCHEAHRRHGWNLNSVREFRLADVPLTNVAQVNMEIVSLARHATRVGSLDAASQHALWTSYWSGEGNVRLDLPSATLGSRDVVESGVLWEYLIDGVLELVEPAT